MWNIFCQQPIIFESLRLDLAALLREGLHGGWRGTFTDHLDSIFKDWLENKKGCKIEFRWD